MRKILQSALLGATAYAATYTYNKKGEDWPQATAWCSSDRKGQQQSPIDLNDDTAVADDEQVLSLSAGSYLNYPSISITSDGFKVSSDLPGDGKLVIDDTEYFNVNVQVHAPSEHTVNGKHYDLEAHFVHTKVDGSLGAVIGVFFDREAGGTTENWFIEDLTGAITDISNSAATSIDSELFVANFIEEATTGEFYRYPGSLTTPPCTEGITWNVMKEVQSISPRQLNVFRNIWEFNSGFAQGNGNNRMVQPLGDRTLLVGGGAHEIDPVLSTAVILGLLLGFTLVALIIVALYYKYFAKTHQAMQQKDAAPIAAAVKAKKVEFSASINPDDQAVTPNQVEAKLPTESEQDSIEDAPVTNQVDVFRTPAAQADDEAPEAEPAEAEAEVEAEEEPAEAEAEAE